MCFQCFPMIMTCQSRGYFRYRRNYIYFTMLYISKYIIINIFIYDIFLHIFSFFDIDINISLNKLNEKKHQNVLLIQINVLLIQIK